MLGYTYLILAIFLIATETFYKLITWNSNQLVMQVQLIKLLYIFFQVTTTVHDINTTPGFLSYTHLGNPLHPLGKTILKF